MPTMFILLYSRMKKRLVVNGILFVILFTVLNACEIDFGDTENHNELNATIVLSNGTTVSFNAKGFDTEMGNSFLSGTIVKGTSTGKASLYLTIYDNNRPAWGRTGPGTYSFDCSYVPNSAEPYPANYTHAYFEPGTVTITVSDEHNMQGYFNSVVCGTGRDSVRISGTFKGDYLEL